MKREIIEKEEINLKLSSEVSLLQQQNKELQEQKEQQEQSQQPQQPPQVNFFFNRPTPDLPPTKSPAKNDDLDSSAILYKEICETLALEKATVEDELKRHKIQLAELQSKLIAAAESPNVRPRFRLPRFPLPLNRCPAS